MPKKKLHFILLFTSIFAMFLFLSGCVEEAYVDELIRPEASVRFLQAESRSGATTFTIYGRAVEGEENVIKAGPVTVDYMDASEYFTIPAGTRKIRIQTTGTLQLDYTTSVTVAADNQSTLALMVDETGEMVVTSLYERYIYSDESNLGSDTCAIRLRNFADTTLAFVRNDGDGPNIQLNIAYFGGSNFYVKGPAGSVRIRGVYRPGAGAPNYVPPYTQRILTDDTFETETNTRYTVALFGTRNNAVIRVYKDASK